jgi:hypothetical protein
MSFGNVYWNANELANDNRAPSILAIGDSWFWYPFPGGSLLNRLGPLVDTMQHTIFAFGNNGAEAFDYVRGVYRDQLASGLESWGNGLSAVFISGGGNDFAGFNDLRPVLKPDCSKIKTARGCFLTGPGKRFDQLLSRAEQSLDELIQWIFAESRPGTTVTLHPYDYAIPTGKGVFSGNKGAWLKPALDDAQVPVALQRPCMVFLIDQLFARLQRLTTKHQPRVFLVDSRGVLTDGDWANELHPKPAGFRKLAEQAWRPVLQLQGLAA